MPSIRSSPVRSGPQVYDTRQIEKQRAAPDAGGSGAAIKKVTCRARSRTGTSATNNNRPSANDKPMNFCEI